jgi:septum formation protein
MLLTMLGIEHEVIPAHVDESPEPGELPEAMVVRVARAKAAAVAAAHHDRLVLAADTTVVVDGRMLGKPADTGDAERMLAVLSGRDHLVMTGVALAQDGRLRSHCDITRVWFRPLEPQTIRDYVATGEPMDKAGSYGLQGYGAVLVDRIDGDYFSVVGLPLRIVARLLEEAGAPYRFTR